MEPLVVGDAAAGAMRRWLRQGWRSRVLELEREVEILALELEVEIRTAFYCLRVRYRSEYHFWRDNFDY